ncbi:MAG: GAF domain-containing protein [Acidobacteriota bacterium]|nr:MAG: GAF domain-containing protein [Acidobacteriota bacterium]
MAESLIFTNLSSRASIYEELIPQLEALLAGETDPVANLANAAAALMEAFGFLWVGFYLVKGDELVLGPFQGPIACSRIGFGNGVCGTSWQRRETVIVPNVDEFPGHIACSSSARSEIVVPIFASDGSVIGVLDIDSDRLDDFSENDTSNLETICNILVRSSGL